MSSVYICGAMLLLLQVVMVSLCINKTLIHHIGSVIIASLET